MSLNSPACLIARPLLKLLGLGPHDFTCPFSQWVERGSNVDAAKMIAISLLWNLDQEANVVKTLHEIRGYLRISQQQAPAADVDLLACCVEAVICRILAKRVEAVSGMSILEVVRTFVIEDFAGDRLEAELMVIIPVIVSQASSLVPFSKTTPGRKGQQGTVTGYR